MVKRTSMTKVPPLEIFTVLLVVHYDKELHFADSPNRQYLKFIFNSLTQKMMKPTGICSSAIFQAVCQMAIPIINSSRSAHAYSYA